MGGESGAYRLWREQRGIEPWVEIREKADKHVEIRSHVKGKKKRVEIAGKYGFQFDSRDVGSMLKYAVDYYSNVGLVFRKKDTGEYKRVSICSRWNTRKEDWYRKRYWDILKSVEGEKRVAMLSVGYDQRRMYELMEEARWNSDFYGFLMARIGDDISAFLKRLRSHYKRKGREWNYGGYAIEPYRESGLPHIHFYFKGGWIAEIDDIIRLWGWSKPQGIKITVKTGNQVAGYLSSYLKKAIHCVQGSRVHLLYAYAYFYGVHLYRVAYGKRKQAEGDSVEIEEGKIPIMEKFEKGGWECVGTDRIGDEEGWDRYFKPFHCESRMRVEEYEEMHRKEEVWKADGWGP